MFKVIKYFTDLQDNRHAYHEGDTFPREGLEVSAERFAELASDKNKRGVPLIEEVIEGPIPFTDPEEIVEEKPVEKPKPKRGRKKG
jgi:hypothetical protein